MTNPTPASAEPTPYPADPAIERADGPGAELAGPVPSSVPTVQPYVPIPQATPPLWAPWYGISFGDAVRRAWKKYSDFDGRASLSEYWWWYLFTAIVSAGGYVVVLIGVGLAVVGGPVGIAVCVLLVVAYFGLAIALFIPSLAVGVRRMHDANYSGLFYLLVFVPFGSVVVIVLMFLPSNAAGASYDRPA
jgi:uncharacterized membrane protein YhaH (DUF805 family)